MEKEKSPLEVELPGFRFHPTEEELLGFYLKKMVLGTNIRLDIIGYLNIYLYDPWVLPGLSKIGEREWYFFVPRNRKHGSGGSGRPNRTTKNGFWKATGSDRKIFGLSEPKRRQQLLGLKKTLVFYKGRAPRGTKTDWVMNEYRLPDSKPFPKDVVLCKIYRKATSMKVLEQRAAMEEDNKTPLSQEFISPNDYLMLPSDESRQDSLLMAEEEMKDEVSDNSPMIPWQVACNGEKQKDEPEEISNANSHGIGKVSSLKLPTEDGVLPDLQLPKTNTDWTQDSFWTHLRSPWLDNLILSSPYANILNF